MYCINSIYNAHTIHSTTLCNDQEYIYKKIIVQSAFIDMILIYFMDFFGLLCIILTRQDKLTHPCGNGKVSAQFGKLVLQVPSLFLSAIELYGSFVCPMGLGVEGY